MAKTTTRHVSTHNDWKFVWALVLSFAAGVANYTTTQNSVYALQRDIATMQDDIKDASKTRERTTVLETKFVSFESTLIQVASDVRYLREGLSTNQPGHVTQPNQPPRYR